MKTLAFIIAATVFEAIGDAVMRIALQYHVMPTRIFLFALATLLLAMYGASLNLAPVEFVEVTGMYIAALSIAFQVANYAFSHQRLSLPVMVGRTLRSIQSPEIGPVVALPQLGGLHHRYERRAA